MKLLTLVMMLMVGCAGAKKEKSVEEQQRVACKGLILAKSKKIHMSTGTRVLDWKVHKYVTEGDSAMVLVEAYVDFAGKNSIRGRWACVFKNKSTNGSIKMIAYLAKNGKWKVTSGAPRQ